MRLPSTRALVALLLLGPLLLAGGAGHAAAQGSAVPLLDVASWPGLAERDRASARRFLAMNLPRALALGPNGAFGWQAGGGDAAAVERLALESCARRANGQDCQVFIRDLAIVGADRPWRAPDPPAGARLSSWNHETVPDGRFLWWGPEQARGVLVFAHGRAPGSADSRGGQPQGWTRRFNNAGYDVWRFDRHPNTDEAERADGWLRGDLAELRRRGYRHIVMAGQSRGGWNTLMTLGAPGLVDVAIAIAPAAHGQTGSANHARQLDDLRRIVDAAAAREARVAIATFRNDPFDAEPDARAEQFRLLGTKVGALLFLDRPDGLEGHSVGAGIPFNDRFGPCLLRFATSATAPTRC